MFVIAELESGDRCCRRIGFFDLGDNVFVVKLGLLGFGNEFWTVRHAARHLVSS